ncbi:hypothetical protein GGR53DRAFT_525212 [Hypoxylon sp. FL1150]|nr:hypothetical protein GGR53DRAFT_525212 [Hypoxylon sp. FL1150]
MGFRRKFMLSKSGLAKGDVASEHADRDTETVTYLATNIVHMLRKNGETLGIAQGQRTGSILPALTSIPPPKSSKASSTFLYPDETVTHVTSLRQLSLQSDADVLTKNGVSHGYIAAKMAIGARQVSIFNENLTTWGIAMIHDTTLISLDDKPIRLIYIGVSSPHEVQVWGPFQFPATQGGEVRTAVLVEALTRLRDTMSACQRSSTHHGAGRESVYSTESLEDQEGSRGIERWMRCPTPPISAKVATDLFDSEVSQKPHKERVEGKIAIFESVIHSRS